MEPTHRTEQGQEHGVFVKHPFISVNLTPLIGINQACCIADPPSPVDSKVLTPGDDCWRSCQRDVDSKRMTPATQGDVDESKSENGAASTPKAEIPEPWA